MQFRLSTLLFLFVVLWSSLAVFGPWGILIFAFLVALAIGIARSWAVVFTLLGLLVLIALLLPAVSCAREAARRAQCGNRMKQLALALHNYRSTNGCLPPAYIADKNGRPMHSWRVLLLPWLEQEPLYKQYSLGEPWDGPHNKKLLTARPREFACPSDKDAYDPTADCTSYVAVVGANAAWSGEKPKTLDDLEPASNTIMLVEVTGAVIPWSEPRDLNLDSPAGAPHPLRVSSKHVPDTEYFHYTPRDGAHVALVDGSVHFLPGDLLDAGEYSDLFRIGGFKRKYLEENWTKSNRQIHWPNCIALTVWIATVIVLLFRASKSRRLLTAKLAEGRAGDAPMDLQENSPVMRQEQQ